MQLQDPVRPRWPAYRRIAESLRHEISTGKLVPGTQLPATNKLAAQLKSSTCTVHNALGILVREGWLERLNGDGTYVAENPKVFTSAGIYHCVDICSNEHPPFQRSVHTALLKRLAALSKEAHIFIDPRPLDAQQTVLPALEEAVRHRRIQCVIAPTINQINSPALGRLPIPVAFTSHPSGRKYVEFDWQHFVRGSAQRLAEQGCRSVGLMLHASRKPPEDGDDLYEKLRSLFLQACHEHNLETRPGWLRAPALYTNRLAPYGYHEFLDFWQLQEKPDGLIVYPDGAVEGVIAAILQTGLSAVTERMKFVFHRNAQIELLCPFPVTWAICDEDRMAEGLVEMLQKQFLGEQPVAIRIPYLFEHAPSGSVGPKS